MAVTETIQELLQGIDDAQYGRDMRQYIHKGIQKCYEEGSAGETDLVAREDTVKLFNNIAPVEETLTASRNYKKGDLLVYDGDLYITKDAINRTQSLMIGTNIEMVTLSDILGDLNISTASINHDASYPVPIDGTIVKYGKVCFVSLPYVSGVSFGKGTKSVLIGRLPSGYRPLAALYGQSNNVFCGLARVTNTQGITKETIDAHLTVTTNYDIRLAYSNVNYADDDYYFYGGFMVFITE